jgi:ribosomal protein S27AE
MITDNPYQDFVDWLKGRWTCPECGETWYAYTGFMTDCLCVSVKGGRVYEKRADCPRCDFEEVIWRKEDE